MFDNICYLEIVQLNDTLCDDDDDTVSIPTSAVKAKLQPMGSRSKNLGITITTYLIDIVNNNCDK